MERRNKGLCFSPTHQCPDKHLCLLIWEGEELPEEALIAVEVEEEQEMVCQILDYIVIDPKEIRHSRTIKFEGLWRDTPLCFWSTVEPAIIYSQGAGGFIGVER
ncbi:hypothetical protein CR513_29270, partial [Mucuna pruriens]